MSGIYSVLDSVQWSEREKKRLRFCAPVPPTIVKSQWFRNCVISQIVSHVTITYLPTFSLNKNRRKQTMAIRKNTPSSCHDCETRYVPLKLIPTMSRANQTSSIRLVTTAQVRHFIITTIDDNKKTSHKSYYYCFLPINSTQPNVLLYQPGFRLEISPPICYIV